MNVINRPHPSEYPSYSHIYFDLIPEPVDILQQMQDNYLEMKALIEPLSEDQLLHRYAPDKWTIKEVLIHIIDDERIFSYRALRHARNDDQALFGFDQDEYAEYSGANERTKESIIEEYEAVRLSTISLFKYLPDDCWDRTGAGIDLDGTVKNERTVRAFAYHIAGHEMRHLKLIKELYLKK